MTPLQITLVSLFLIIICSTITSFIGKNAPIFELNENQIFYLYSTTAQVLAGVFGLTLTGFIFFRNELSREEFDDETLTQTVESLKRRYFRVLMFLTFLSIITLFISNIAISIENNNNTFFTTIILNTAQSTFVVTILVISYFIFDVIEPKRIEKESRSIQQKVDPRPDEYIKGSLEEFLTNYNEIEYIIQKYGQAYQSEFNNGYGRTKKRISNVRLTEFIYRAEKINLELFEEIIKLITLRNSIIHGAEPIVSEKMVKNSEDILQKLKNALNVG